MDQHIADLLGLDLNNPEDLAAIAKAEAEAAIDRRQHIDGDALTRDWNELAPELQARIQAGIAQANRGETRDLGDFSQYLDEK